MDQEELRKILAEHKKWLESNGKEGKRADLCMADLDRAYLVNADLKRANLIGATLVEAVLGHASLQEADLGGSNLTRANLMMADLSGADLAWTNLTMAHLNGANLSGTDLFAANLSEANVSLVRFNRWTKYKGTRLDGCRGSLHFKRFALDQEYIEDFRGSPRSWRFWLLYLPWLIFADCGRSISLWAAWCVAFATFFGFVYHSLGPDAFLIASKASPGGTLSLGFSLETMIYYSVVTFTTLGFGDISPLTHEAARWVMAEVVLGYVMLGGLISIFANKLARRA